MNQDPRDFAKENIQELCEEILEWMDTSVLRNGKVRELAEALHKSSPSEDPITMLTLAEHVVAKVAMGVVASGKYKNN